MAKKVIYKCIKNIFMIILCVAVCLTATPINQMQADEIEEPVYNPTISVSSTSVQAGDYAYFYVHASQFQNIAGLEYSIYYDTDVMSIEYTSDGYFLDGSSKSINTDTPGQIKCSVLNIDGLNGDGELLCICFKVNSEAAPGNYPVSITVGSVYDTGLSSVTVGKASGYLTVLESINDAKTATFATSTDNYQVSKGDTVTYRLYGLETYDLAAGNFVFTYDETLLEFVDLSLGLALQTEKAIFLVNSEKPGMVKVSYANIEAILQEYYTEYFVLTFQVIGEKEQKISTVIDFDASSLIDENLGNLRTDMQSCSVYIQPTPKANPVFKLMESALPCDSNKFKVDVVLGENANVAAGDFTINYNSSDVVCTGVEVNSAVQSSGGLLIYNENIDNGTVKFSYATMSPFTTEQTLLTLEFEMAGSQFDSTYIECSGRNVVDAEYNPVTMDYLSYEYMSPVMPGDVNGDGRVNVRDVIAVRKYIVDNSTAIDILAADVDGNGRINVRDVIAIRKIIVGQ